MSFFPAHKFGNLDLRKQEITAVLNKIKAFGF